ncbi:MAG: spirocyclase AveC family protein [Aeromicrobium sp.]
MMHPAHKTEAADLSRQSRPAVYYWAAVGAGILVFNVYLYSAWVLNGRFEPTPMGPDPVPTAAKIGVWVFQGSSILLATGTILYVVRQSWRERKLTFDAAVVIGWGLASWQDPLYNWIRPAFFYNSYFFNRGGWIDHAPGWSSPRGGWLPEDIIGTAGIGYLWFLIPMMIACRLMAAARRRWPTIGVGGLFLVALAFVGGFDFAVEVTCVHIGLWGYPGAIHSLSIFPGTTDQFPIYETLAWGSVWAACSLLRFYRDDRGNSVVERGIDDLPLGEKARGAVRALAVAAGINAIFAIYSLFMIWTTLLPGIDAPEYPSYLRDGLCGHGTPYQCIDSNLPIPVRAGGD